jgi:hypothetical protein
MSLLVIITYKGESTMPLLSFLLFVFVTSFTPGPNNIMAMLFANKYGLKKTIKFCFGVGAGFFVIMLLCSYFNVLLENFIPKIEFIMTILGAIYMLFYSRHAFTIHKSKRHSLWHHGNIDLHPTLSLFKFQLTILFIISGFCWFYEYVLLEYVRFCFSNVFIKV